jgi:acetyl-CoA carboxylase biotin carboxyl carrier protein
MSKIINADAVRELAALLAETGLGEIEYESGEIKIRVARQSGASVPAVVIPSAMSAAPVPSIEAAKTSLANHPGTVRSPMVGTVYLSPEPGAPAFVSVGDTVREGQTLLLIEAMKTFNEIKAPRNGTIRQIMVENQQPVEFGEVLTVIE